ncbi:hypothetical protein C8F04DRAFT_1183381 [Mycena alexandri]|uniref:Uncharacterized protein n=1 Tax=Mycena alexandri TaxID=1745969 RepID=A0AAD6SV05_9AGAR|nr:hypothetical protein C8F04DRAFT_1183381 [Mycena alexandri]
MPPLRVPESRSSVPTTPEAAVVNSPPQELAELYRPLAMRLSQPRDLAPLQARLPPRSLDTVPQSGRNPPTLLGHLTEAPRVDSSSLLMRMGNSASKEEKSLLRRTGVQLHERISETKKAPRHRKHDRTKRRINKLVGQEKEIATPALPSFPWTDEEIDFFIDQEEGPPPPDEEYLPYGDFYDTDDE